MRKKFTNNSLFKREIREIVDQISEEGVKAVTNSKGFNGHIKATEFSNDNRPKEFTPSTIIISDGHATWNLRIPKEILKDLITARLNIETIRTHGMLHSPVQGKCARIYVNNQLVDEIKLVKPHPHGTDYGVDSRRSIPIFHYIDKNNETQIIKIEVEDKTYWDVDYITLEPIIKRKEWRPGATMIIGAIISAIIGGFVTILINYFYK